MLHTLAFQIPGIDQSFLLLVFGLLIFGKRLPEVGRSLGKGIVEFKRGIKGIEDDVESASSVPTAPVATTALTQSAQPAYKFDPHTGQPIQPPAEPTMKFDPYTGKPLTPGAVPTVVDAEVVPSPAHTPIQGY